MSIPYSEFPVYIGQVGVGSSTPPHEVNGYIPATQASVSYNTSSSVRRKLGKNVDASDQFVFNGALSADISFSCLLQSGMVSGLDFLLDSNQDNFVTMKLGGELYYKCYAKDLSLSVSPFEPVILSANFVSLQPAVGGTLNGDINPYAGGVPPLDTDLIVYGHTCSVNDNADVLGQVQSQINFKRTYTRTPIYGLGSVNASSMLLDGVEEEISVSSTGLNTLINFSGEKLTTLLEVDLGIQGNVVGIGSSPTEDLIKFPAGARVLTQSYSAQGGETVQTTATIKQAKL
jgi:hypothetical protein